MVGGHPVRTCSFFFNYKNRVCFVLSLSMAFSYRSIFILIMEPTQIFPTLDEAFHHYRSQMLALGYNINKRRSKRNRFGAIYKVSLVCQHSRLYENSRLHLDISTRIKNTSTSRLNCPWSAVLQANSDLNQWSISLICDNHNNQPAMDASAFSSARALNDDQKSKIVRMMRAGSEPKSIIVALRQEYPGISLLSQDIYNVIRGHVQKNWQGEVL